MAIETKLKQFMNEHFYFAGLKKAGVFKDIKFNDYEAQAKRICELFGLESIYEYGKETIRCHISYSSPVKEAGQHEIAEHRPFITEIFPKDKNIAVIPSNKQNKEK